MTSPARIVLDAAVTERQFLAQVRDLARLCGWRSYHTFDSRRSDEGFPDLLLVRGERAVAAELKTMRGRTTPKQVEWLAALDGATVESHLWRPSNLHEIKDVLR